MTDTNSNFLLFTIETGWSVEMVDGNAILTNDNGASISIYEDHAVLKEPRKRAESARSYTNLMSKFSKIYHIKWYDDEVDRPIVWGSRSSDDYEISLYVMCSQSHPPNTNE